jgi:hypothetical protein
VRSLIPPALAVAGVLFAARRAEAYRPFDQTDGDTAELDTIELEIGATQVALVDGHLVAVPTGVFNYGFSKGWELVIDLDVLVKHVLRAGCLQDRTGPSIALETGPLLPTVPQLDDEAGWSADLILSQTLGPIIVHANELVEATRDRQFLYTTGAIVEGPRAWTVRPVGEAYIGAQDGAEITSVLAGAIWTASEHVAVDAAVRHDREGAVIGNELRIGVTWVIQL